MPPLPPGGTALRQVIAPELPYLDSPPRGLKSQLQPCFGSSPILVSATSPSAGRRVAQRPPPSAMQGTALPVLAGWGPPPSPAPRASVRACVRALSSSAVRTVPRKPHLARSFLSLHSEAAWTRPPQFALLKSLPKWGPLLHAVSPHPQHGKFPILGDPP
jgi:hypothetical protein